MKKIFFIVFLTIFFVSCGDVNDGPGKIEPLSDSRVPTCILEDNAFSYILDKNIVDQIDCLYEQLEFFMRIAIEEGETEITPDKVRKSTLREFVSAKMNNNGQSELLLKHFDLLFSVNGAVFGTNDEELNIEDIEKLKEFMKIFNRKVVSVNRLFHQYTSNDRLPYSTHKNNKKMIMDALDHVLRKASFSKKVRDEETGKIVEKEIDVSLLTILNIRPGATPKPVDLSKLIRAFEDIDHENRDLIENLVSVRYLKSVFLGGSSDYLERKEFIEFARDKAESLMSVFYDLYRFQHIAYDPSNLEERYSIYAKHLDEVRDKLIFRTEEERRTGNDNNAREIIHVDKIFHFIKVFGRDFFGDSFDIKQILSYRWEALRAKKIFIGNSNPSFNFFDIKNLIKYMEDFTETGIAYSELFKKNRDIILKGKKITSATNIKGRTEGDTYLNSFKNILKRYRYFTGDRELPLFGNTYDRNIEGIIEQRIFEILLNKVVGFIEKEYPCDKGRVEDVKNHVSSFEVYNTYTQKMERVKIEDSFTCINPSKPGEDYNLSLMAGQVYLTLMEFRRAFNDFGVITKGDEYGSVSNIISLSDLFSYVGNDNQKVEVPELVELFMNIFNATNVQNRLAKEIRRRCHQNSGTYKEIDYISENAKEIKIFDIPEDDLIEIDSKDGFHPGSIGTGSRYDSQCVRENFFKIMKKPFRTSNGSVFTYFDYLTKLNTFYKKIIESSTSSSQSKIEVEKFVLLLEKFTKSCSQDNMPYSSSDVMALFAGLFNIEATIAKFDLDKDNIISTQKIPAKDIEGGDISSDYAGKVSETDLAFEHFKPGLIALLPSPLDNTTGAKLLFKYLVNRKQAPDPALKIGEAVFMKVKNIDRSTLAAILGALGGANIEQDKKNAKLIDRNYVTKKTQCKYKLPLKERKKPFDQRLNCTKWNTYFPDLKRSDCDFPLDIIQKTEEVEEATSFEYAKILDSVEQNWNSFWND